MSVDCSWVEKNLESFFCDTLSEEENRLTRAHIESCAACGREARALNAIDPLMKTYFRREMAVATRPRAVHQGRVFAFASASAVALIVLLSFALRTTQPVPAGQSVSNEPVAAPAVSTEPAVPPRDNTPVEPVRAKPNAVPVAADRMPPIPPVSPNAQDFMVTDPAGYSHTLDEYRGRTVVMGVWNQEQVEAAVNLERVYKDYSESTRIRFLGVSLERQPRPANTTFTIFYNQGSKLFGAQPGEFVVLNENGVVELRGSLVKDFETLRRFLQARA